jgi:glucose/arabinose dehydrogenase
MRRCTAGSLLGICVLVVTGCKRDEDAASEGADTSGTTSSATTAMTSTHDTTTDPTNGPGESTSTSADTDVADSTGETGELECPYTPIDGQPAVELELVANGFDRPVLAVGHPTEPDRLFVVEQGGRVRLLEPGMTEAPAEAFLEIPVSNANNTHIGNEQGLLGFALHPDFPNDPRVYVAYNPPGGGSPPTVVEEYSVGGDGTVDPSTARVVIETAQPQGNHNGGMIAFGPDGYLYVGTGDGGGSGDPYATGRNPAYILAKMLRIGVQPDGTTNTPVSCGGACGTPKSFDYTIPADNPFVNDDAFAPEVWAWGFRNPWRFSFDQQTGDLYVADVGQNAREEVALVVAGSDHGWNNMEGFACYSGSCDPRGPNEINDDGQTMPLVDYSIAGPRCAVMGLGVYRSCEVPAFDGVYFYGDYCTGEVFALVWDGQSVTELGTVWTTTASDRILGGGNNAYGDVFVTSVAVPFPGAPIEDGRLYRVTAANR